MNVISSELVWKHLQVNGRYWVREKHILDNGIELIRDYMNGEDAEEKLLINAQEIQNSLNESIEE